MEFVFLPVQIIKLEEMEFVYVPLEIELLMEFVQNVQFILSMLMEFAYVIMVILQLMVNVKCFHVQILIMFMIP